MTTNDATRATAEGMPAPHHVNALSFMRVREPAGSGIDYWVVEPTGNYSTDHAKGEELADEYLKYLGEHPTGGNVTLLGPIVNSMLTRPEVQASGSLTGLEIGFLRVVNEYAGFMARSFHNIGYQPTRKGGAA